MSPADQSVGKQLPYVPEHSASLTGRLSWRSWAFLYKWAFYSERFTMSSNDYWESAVVNPDIVLRDLIKIFHPELVEEPFVYYKQLF